MKQQVVRNILQQPSYSFSTREVRAAVTRTGGHLGPVTFLLGGRAIQPFSVAPWWKEKPTRGIPPLLQVLRGDFFCLPFGGNSTAFRGERHPVHGETANGRWQWAGYSRTREAVTLQLRFKTRIRQGSVEKRITLVPGQTMVYQEHVITGMGGPMNMGHHAMLKFPDRPGSGRLSTSARIHCQVFIEPVENPELRGYSILKPAAVFEDLAAVPMITGEMADLSRYPARRGFEDIVILVADPKLPVAWTAVAFPEEGYVWFSLRDPRVLASTLLWMSNGGRHYAPWNGRHINVMGVEDITGFFHCGLAESAAPNALSRLGVKTHHVLNLQQTLAVRYIMGVAAIPKRFERVKDIVLEKNVARIMSDAGLEVKTAVNADFLLSGG